MKPLVTVCVLGLLASVSISALADDARVRQLELDVAQLRRDVMAQARRIDELERQLSRGVQQAAKEPGVEAPVVTPVSSAWLFAANWERIRPGMAEYDVVQLLGVPTSMRADSSSETKTLLYALEVAPGAFVAGSIEIANGRVAEVKKPVLR